MKVKRGDILLINLGNENKIGSEQGGLTRPACVISNDIGNMHSTTLIVALLTSKEKKTKENKTYPMHVSLNTTDIIGKLEEDSIILFEQLYTIDKERIILKKGHVNPSGDKLAQIDDAIKISLGIPVE